MPVNAGSVPAVGERLRDARLRRGISLRALARDVGVSASLISQIETGKSQPSVSTLYAITSALGIPIEYVFADVLKAGEPTAAPDVRPQVPAGAGADGPAAVVGGGLPAGIAAGVGTLLDVLGSARGSRVGPLMRPAEREVLALDSGVTWQRLGHLPDTHVDFLLITYQPGGSSSSTGLLMRHSGAEYGYLLSGELVLTLGFDEHRLTAGDSVCFESSRPHRYRNDGDIPAVGVWFVAEPP
jgi:DNA-binding XRE family transcriptional regulator/quercetin dioxygenase-like cupin family protein